MNHDFFWQFLTQIENNNEPYIMKIHLTVIISDFIGIFMTQVDFLMALFY